MYLKKQLLFCGIFYFPFKPLKPLFVAQSLGKIMPYYMAHKSLKSALYLIIWLLISFHKPYWPLPPFDPYCLAYTIHLHY